MMNIKELSLEKEIQLANGVEFLGDVNFLRYGGLFVKQLGEDFECIYVEVNEDENILNFYEGCFTKYDLKAETFIGDLKAIEKYADIEINKADFTNIIDSIISYYGAYNFLEKINIESETDVMNILLIQSFVVVEDIYYVDIDMSHTDVDKKVLKGIIGNNKEDILEKVAAEYDIEKSFLTIVKEKVKLPTITVTGAFYINEFNTKEFGHEFENDGSNEIGLAYTEIEEDDGTINPVQVTINFGEDIQLITTKNNKILEIIKYDSILELEENLLKNMDFDSLISIAYEDEDYFNLVS